MRVNFAMVARHYFENYFSTIPGDCICFWPDEQRAEAGSDSGSEPEALGRGGVFPNVGVYLCERCRYQVAAGRNFQDLFDHHSVWVEFNKKDLSPSEHRDRIVEVIQSEFDKSFTGDIPEAEKAKFSIQNDYRRLRKSYINTKERLRTLGIEAADAYLTEVENIPRVIFQRSCLTAAFEEAALAEQERSQAATVRGSRRQTRDHAPRKEAVPGPNPDTAKMQNAQGRGGASAASTDKDGPAYTVAISGGCAALLLGLGCDTFYRIQQSATQNLVEVVDAGGSAVTEVLLAASTAGREAVEAGSDVINGGIRIVGGCCVVFLVTAAGLKIIFATRTDLDRGCPSNNSGDGPRRPRRRGLLGSSSSDSDQSSQQHRQVEQHYISTPPPGLEFLPRNEQPPPREPVPKRIAIFPYARAGEPILGPASSGPLALCDIGRVQISGIGKEAWHRMAGAIWSGVAKSNILEMPLPIAAERQRKHGRELFQQQCVCLVRPGYIGESVAVVLRRSGEANYYGDHTVTIPVADPSRCQCDCPAGMAKPPRECRHRYAALFLFQGTAARDCEFIPEVGARDNALLAQHLSAKNDENRELKKQLAEAQARLATSHSQTLAICDAAAPLWPSIGVQEFHDGIRSAEAEVLMIIGKFDSTQAVIDLAASLKGAAERKVGVHVLFNETDVRRNADVRAALLAVRARGGITRVRRDSLPPLYTNALLSRRLILSTCTPFSARSQSEHTCSARSVVHNPPPAEYEAARQGFIADSDTCQAWDEGDGARYR